MRIVNLPNDHVMRSLGFTDHVPAQWYLCKSVGPATTLNISINKKTHVWTEEVLNEYFLQTEYYGVLPEPLRSIIKNGVDREIEVLNKNGFDIFFDHSQYGWSDHKETQTH